MTGTNNQIQSNTAGIQAGNINISSGNTISSTDTNGNINIVPNGTGIVMLTGSTPFALSGTGTIQSSKISATPAIALGSFTNGSGNPGTYNSYKSRSTSIGSYVAVQTGDQLQTFVAYGDDGTTFKRAAAAIVTATGTISSGIVPGQWNWYTANSSGALTLGMTLSNAQILSLTNPLPVSSGGLGITSTPSNGNIPIGNGTTYTASTLTAGTNIKVTNGAGSITLASSTAVSSITSTVTNGTTTTLTSSSNQIQRFTGSSTQTCVLPDAGTLTVGQKFEIINQSTGAVTVNTADAVLFVTVAANSTLTVICNTASGTTASSWSYQYLPSTSGITGTGSTVRATSPTLVTPSLGVATATSINFGGTALGTYSDSSFVPVLNFGGANTGITYSVQVGLYSRIGNIVTFYVIVILTSKGSATGNATVTGFPFAPRSSGNPAFSLFLENVTFTNTPICFLSGTTMQLKQLNSAAGASYLTDASFTNTSDFIITGSYLV